MKSIYVFLIVCFFFAEAFAQDTSLSVTLKEAVETAIQNNLQVKQQELLMESAQINWRQAKAERFPSISGFANHGINQGRSIDPFTNAFINQQVNYAGYGLNTAVVLFNGLGILNNVKANALGYDAARWELQQMKDNVTLNVILAYLQVLSNSDQLTQSRNTIAVTREQIDRLEILNRQGAIAPALLFDLRGQLASDEVILINSENALNSSKLLLSQLLNVPYTKDLVVARVQLDEFNPEYSAQIEEIYQIALNQLAVVKAANLRKLSAEKAVKAAKGDFYPSLGLSGQVNTNYSSVASRAIFLNSVEDSTGYVLVNGAKTPVIVSQPNFANEKIRYNDQLSSNLFTTVNLALRIPIFSALQTRTRVRQAQITQKNFEYIEQTTLIQLKQNIEQAYFNMTAARERYKALVEQVRAFTASFRAAEVRFASGVGTSVDYIIAKNNMDRANISLINSRYDFLLRTKVLDYYQGKPLW